MGITRVPQPTDEELVEAKKLYRQGLKVPSICNHFGGRYSIDIISRHVVPGYREKRNEAAAMRRETNPAPSDLRRGSRVKAEHKNLAFRIQQKLDAPSAPLPKASPAIPESLNLEIQDVPLGGCRFPTSSHDAPTNGHRFCGAPAGEATYCPHHARIATGGLPVRKKPGAPLGR